MSLVHLALRNHAKTLLVCSSGIGTLSAQTFGANSFGYERASGSFEANKFAAGMEVRPSGFTDATPRVISEVTPTRLYTTKEPATDIAAGSREITVGFPSAFALENSDFDPPTDGRGYIEEDFVPATRALTTNSPNGEVLAQGLYVLRWYAPKDSGFLGLRTMAEALVDHFPKAWAQTLSDGSQVRTRNELLPTAGQITNRGSFALCVISIPWKHERNS